MRTSTTRSAWILPRRVDRAGEGKAYGNLGNAHESLGDFSNANKCHTQWLAIAKEVGDRAGEGRAYGNLGTGHMHLNEYVKSVAYFEAQHGLAISLKLAHVQSDAELNMGVALIPDVRAGRGPSTGADKTLGPPSQIDVARGARDGSAPQNHLGRPQSHLDFISGHLGRPRNRLGASPRGDSEAVRDGPR